MTISNVNAINTERRQFQDLFPTVIEYEADYDPASVGSNGNVSETIEVIGARRGDFVMLSVEADLQELILSGYVNAKDTVTINLVNPTAGAINLGIIDLHIILLRPTHLH